MTKYALRPSTSNKRGQNFNLTHAFILHQKKRNKQRSTEVHRQKKKQTNKSKEKSECRQRATVSGRWFLSDSQNIEEAELNMTNNK